jgi:E3 ubiquitin-protein ligase SHPRH
MVLVQRSTLPHGSGSQKRINCPSCRRRANVGDVAYVDNVSERPGPDPSVSQFHGGEDGDEELTLSVKGSYGTKLEAVVRRILWVKAKDPNAKVLLFSEWQDVLDVVEHALTANHITFARIKERGSTTPLSFFLI